MTREEVGDLVFLGGLQSEPVVVIGIGIGGGRGGTREGCEGCEDGSGSCGSELGGGIGCHGPRFAVEELQGGSFEEVGLIDESEPCGYGEVGPTLVDDFLGDFDVCSSLSRDFQVGIEDDGGEGHCRRCLVPCVTIPQGNNLIFYGNCHGCI